MNIFHKVTLQSMKKSRTRTVVTIIGVILSTAMITGVATFGMSLLNYMVEGAAARYGNWHVGFSDVDVAFAQARAADEDVVNTVAFENIGYAAFEGGKNPDKPYLFLAGYGDEAFDTVPVNLMYGRLPENSGEIVISGKAETDGGVKLKVGDTLSLEVGNRADSGRKLGLQDPYSGGETLVSNKEKTYTIVGVCRSPVFEGDSAPYYTAITKADHQEPGDNFSVFVTLKNPRKAVAYASDTAGTGAYFLNDNVLRFLGASPEDKLFTTLLYVVGGIVIAIIMIGAVFLIYNAFYISLNERTHQFGILSSVGATARQLRNAVLFEGLCIGVIGIPIGILIGIGSIGAIIPMIAGEFGSFAYGAVPLTLSVSPLAVIAAAAASLVTILISAYIPARKAANTPVMESIRQTNEVKIKGGSVKTSKITARVYGLEGTLALKNFKRNKKRYRSIVLSLTLSVVLFVAGSTFGTELKQASEMAMAFTTYDIALIAQDMDDSEMLRLYDKLKTIDGVSEGMRQAVIKTYSCAVKARDLSGYYRECAGLDSPEKTVYLPVDLQFIEDSAYLDIIKELGLSPAEYTGDSGKMIAVAAVPPPNMEGRSKELDEFIDLFASPALNVTLTSEANDRQRVGQERSVNMTFVRMVIPDTPPVLSQSYESQSFFFNALAPYSLKDKFEAEDTPFAVKGMTFRAQNPSQAVAQMETMIQGAGVTSGYQLLNLNKVLEENRSMMFVANVFTYIFVIMISLIAVANVFNTISTNIKLRRRELAMLRSVGMSDRDFNKMMNFECSFYGIMTLLVGLPISGVISWLIYKGMFIGGAENIEFLFPWKSMVISTLGVFLIVFITTLYAVGKIKKENIIDALRDDMT